VTIELFPIINLPLDDTVNEPFISSFFVGDFLILTPICEGILKEPNMLTDIAPSKFKNTSFDDKLGLE
jgi:hypothetical protein